MATRSRTTVAATCEITPQLVSPRVHALGEVARVNAGGDAVGTFGVDRFYSGGGYYVSGNVVATSGVENAASPELYQSERVGNFSYSFSGLSPGAPYTVRLHFAEIWFDSDSAGARVFQVAINGALVLENFDIVSVAGGANKAVVREFRPVANAEGRIVVDFVSVVDNAKVSGIELIPPANQAPALLEPVLQLNSGGDAVSSFGEDELFAGGWTYSSNNPITTSGVANAAPAEVYQSERWGLDSYTSSGLTPGALYTVRLHFAEIYYTSAGSRVFHVGINGKSVLEYFDIYSEAGANKALVKDFSAIATEDGQIVVSFWGAIDNPKLSALEVLKPVEQSSPTLPGRTIGAGRHPLVSGCNATAVAFSERTDDSAAVYLSTFKPAGEALDSVQVAQTRVSTPNPGVAALPGDDFAVAWTDFDDDELGISLRKVVAGVPQDNAIIANEDRAFSQSDSDIVFDGNKLVVAWMDSHDAANGPDLHYRLFTPDLKPLSGDQVLAATGAVEDNVVLAGRSGHWAAAWRAGSQGKETIEVQSGASHWTVGPFLPGATDNRPDLIFLDDTHLAVAFTIGTDPDNTGTANVPRLHAAVLGANSPGIAESFALAPARSPYATLPSVGQSEPNLVLSANELLLAWRSSAIPGDSHGSELWLRRVPFISLGDKVMLNPSVVEAPLIQTNAQREGDQDAFRMVATTLWPSGGVATVWDDFNHSFGAKAGGPDVVLQIAAREADAGGACPAFGPNQPVPLQNATATFSQTSFGGNPITMAIDGQIVVNNGWAIYEGSNSDGPNAIDRTHAQTAVFEAVSDIGVTGSLLTVKLHHWHQLAGHSLGRFRISVTADPRSDFADGALSGGDVTANWEPLQPIDVSATGEVTLTILADQSIVASGAPPADTVYTVVAPAPLGAITGFRLEALEGADFPDFGPGRYSNGNFVLTEFEVQDSDCTVEPVLSWTSPSVTKLNVSNDSDPLVAGWQGYLVVQTALAGTGATVQFAAGSGNLGPPVAVDAGGKATSALVTIPDAPSVTLTATTSSVPGRGIRSTSLTVLVDTLPPPAIGNLAASVPPELRRQTTFRLDWTAPNDQGARVSSYDVRVSKGTPIGAANFDAQAQIAYSHLASAAGAADGVDVSDRLIENNYYFAVAAIDQAGNRGPMAFAGPAAAHFNSTLLATGITDELFGFTADGSTSIDGDAYSDLIVGSYISNTVRIYMGSPSGYPSIPSATIEGVPIIPPPCTGPDLNCASFGRAAKIIGDIDSDGLPDLAIGSTVENGTGNVYIFKGRHPWPTLLHESDADYVVRATTGFSGAHHGLDIARLGDVNADGIDDFAVSAPLYGVDLGRISVVYGVPPGTAFGSVSLPADYGTRALEIDGSAGLLLGAHVVSLGPNYANTFVASAHAATNALPPTSAGSAFAFAAQQAVGPISIANAIQTFPGPVPTGRTGIGLAFLGGGGSLPLIGIGSPSYLSNPAAGQVDIFTGSAVGPFGGAHAIYTNSRATLVGDGFGVAVVGGAFPNGETTSFLGDSAPDVVLGGLREGGGGTHVYFLTGQNAATPGTRDIVSAADASYQMPSDWQGCSYFSSAIKDLNGDSYGDIAIGEWRRTTGYNGRLVVLW